MGDSFWMEDEVKVEWEETALDCGRIFRNFHKSASSDPLSFMDSQIKKYIFQESRYPVTDTGSQYLDPIWRKNAIKIKSEPAKLQVLICLN